MKIKTNQNAKAFYALKPGDVFRTADGTVGMKLEDATINGITLNAVLISDNKMAEIIGAEPVEVFYDAVLILQEA